MPARDARCFLACALAAALALPVPATACTLFPPPLALPDEPKEAFALRAQSLLAAQYDEERRRWQESHFEEAERVLLARVTAVRTTPGDQSPLVTAHGLIAIKGDLPSAPSQVRDDRMRSCAAIVGGSRRAARPGDYIILFDATRLNPGDPAITLEIPVHEARDPRLISAINAAPSQLRKQAEP